MIGLPQVRDGFFHQGRRGTGLDAGAARHAFRIQKIGGTRGDLGLETPSINRKSEGALNLFTRTHATRTDDALGRIETEIGVRRVLGAHEVVLAFGAIAHFAQTDDAGHVLKLAVPVGGTGEAIERMVADVQLHRVATQFGEFIGLRGYFHARLRRRSARSGKSATALNFDEAKPAGTERFEVIGGAQFWDAHSGIEGGTHHRGASRDPHFHPVDLKRDEFVGHPDGCACVRFFVRIHGSRFSG